MTVESKNEQIARLHRKLDAAQAQCHDSTELLNTERLRNADLRAALRRIVAIDGWSEGDPAEATRVATRVAADALEDGQDDLRGRRHSPGRRCRLVYTAKGPAGDDPGQRAGRVAFVPARAVAPKGAWTLVYWPGVAAASRPTLRPVSLPDLLGQAEPGFRPTKRQRGRRPRRSSVSLPHVQNLERGLRPKRSAALARLLDALSCAEAGQSEAPGSTGAPRRVADGGDHDEQ